MKNLVVIPTYNERENIEPLVRAIFAQQPEVSILVVDDSSPDGTAARVQDLQRQLPQAKQLHLLVRKNKEGLGKAYLAGFAWGLAQGFEGLIEMDADFSHRPQDLNLLVAALAKSDFVIGSRYVAGGGTSNWGIVRKLISRGGSIYSRLILGYPLADWTGGFNAWRRRTLEKIGIEQVFSNGYSFQIELKYRALLAGCRGQEVPILFEERRLGQSKMSLRIVLEAFYRVWHLRWAIRKSAAIEGAGEGPPVA